LDVNLHYAGMIPHSKEIKHAVARRKPVTIEKPNALVSGAFSEVAARLLKVPLAKIEGLKFFDNAGVK
jgi:MinD-like ATPase involved in chromosome partitioning or flagellar assembly